MSRAKINYELKLEIKIRFAMLSNNFNSNSAFIALNLH